VLVERDPGAVDAIKRNLRSTRLAGKARVQRRSVAAFLHDAPPPEAPFDLVLLDPPYDLAPRELATVLDALTVPGWVSAEAVVVVEQASGAAPLPAPDHLEARWERVYGDTLVRILSL
jgi:16S rRNA (guanine966-N2)-methyltransferase